MAFFSDGRQSVNQQFIEAVLKVFQFNFLTCSPRN